MAKHGHRLWLGGVVLVVVALGVSACGDDDLTPAPGAAGGGGSGGEQPTAGQAGSAQAGASAGEAGNGGSAGQGGGPGCVDGLRVVKVVQASVGEIIGWPAQRRVGVSVSGERVVLYELSEDSGVTVAETLGVEDLGLSADGSISWLTRFGDGFLVQGVTGGASSEPRIVNWQPGAPLETVPSPEPSSGWFTITAADPEIGIAAATRDGVRLATLDSDTWTWSEPFDDGARRHVPLALEDDRILVGVEEADRFSMGGAGNEGGAAAGGAGGAVDLPSSSQARLEWWTVQGQQLETHAAEGNPQVAVKVSEGWLIGETNSFWGSYRAGIELLLDSGGLRKLTDVPVISAGDGTDGALDLALLGSRLLVANCESGLRVGDWSTSSVTLSSLPGPWHPRAAGYCSPSRIEVQGDFAVIGGTDTLVFARACD
jgi:hypothetical protein